MSNKKKDEAATVAAVATPEEDDGEQLTLRAIREKVRGFRRAGEKADASLGERIDALSVKLSDLRDELAKRISVIEELIAAGGTTEPGTGEYPAGVHDLATLKQFVTAAFGQAYLMASYDGAGKKLACAAIRNALAIRYPATIKRLNDDPIGNGYHAPEAKHSDAIWYVPGATVIDFCSASDAAGTLDQDLTWRPEPINPW